ncbi:uncharacterized protein VDAG_08291 [Verticillium dahliae VdLs.17]|uniref:Uncharacterized protein n=1 Tax=Verticillium dahliae (strain VdLs.17 / ATCC MYA-4575 / FGSC 10137) TaxID=498257 RepID=G2XDQ9_VERDV|nr:uncharacterized protein VDAG_08291 [Verticillium dahliae VdLs.17]EGY17127.1 hypothetical protein VDAG_08291 [Verticillium dahliae VdLs.17]
MHYPAPNYFTCTLGQAYLLKRDAQSLPSFKTITDMLDEQASRLPDVPALGLAACTEETEITHGNLPFLLARSTWRPQSNSQSIEHLCEELEISCILVNTPYTSVNFEIGVDVQVINIPQLPMLSEVQIHAQGSDLETELGDRDPPFYFHTSGTSTGLPKPIPQASSIVSALPRLDTASQPATFSTTPLYHGGLIDCLRCWSSGAMLWLFPEAELPVTAGNVVRSIDACRKSCTVPIQYFSSVPYVLQMLAEDDYGIRTLQSMKLVGVGGAALATVTGDRLVAAGVNLLSRFGSAECGFLASSHRDYSFDKEWQYLRFGDVKEFVKFEGRHDDLAELLVKPTWSLQS